MSEIKDTIIIGNGPAGLTAAIYGLRAGLSVLLITNNPMDGGQIATTYTVDNYPGLPGVDGSELGMKFREHANSFGLEALIEGVSSIKKDGDIFSVTTNKGTYQGKTVIIACGADHRKLGVPGEKEFTGMGVSYCATCDGAFFRKKIVAVVGGGDTALGDAIFLSRFAEKVFIIHRRDEFRGAKILVDQIKANDKIEIIYDSVVDEVVGVNEMVDHLMVRNVKSNEVTELKVNGVFMAVGITPNIGNLTGLPDQDDTGYIKAGEDCITSIPGIFAAGDIRTKQLRQVVTAAADGANAITSVQSYLQNK
ncbi:MAG: thioredoxin-disulfide reductase [Lachnospiraceae bacterium]|nr:thioredoxin-disulfide reductase [Lachnospiraceae bacterium]